MLTIGVTVAIVLLYAIIDMLILTPEQQLNALILRIGVVIIGAFSLLALHYLASPQAFDITISLFEVITLSLLLTIFYHYRADTPTVVSAIVLIILGLYLFIPNRYLLTSIIALSGSLAYLLIAALVHHSPISFLAHLIIALIAANVIGLTYTHRQHINKRRIFHDLMAERETRKQLQEEMAQRKHLEEQLWHMAQTDALTGLSNRRHFMEQAEAEINRCRRYAHPLSLLMIDLDHFKKLNDTLGHSAGDAALQKISTLYLKSLRNSDIPGRIGGEEFAILTPEQDRESALRTAERIRQSVEENFANAPFPLTVSIGVAEFQFGEQTLSSLLMQADSAMYAAKQNGRNQVVVYQHD